jgi:hypothetical protein
MAHGKTLLISDRFKPIRLPQPNQTLWANHQPQKQFGTLVLNRLE